MKNHNLPTEITLYGCYVSELSPYCSGAEALLDELGYEYEDLTQSPTYGTENCLVDVTFTGIKLMNEQDYLEQPE